MMNQIFLEAKEIKKQYRIKSFFQKEKTIKALDGVSFSLGLKETLAVVGESGCGKSTLAKVLMRIEPCDEGEIYLNQKKIEDFNKKDFLNKIQMIFQDPYSSLNPRKKAWKIVGEPLFVNTDFSEMKCRQKVAEILFQVGLRPETMERYPHMFSGGQRQRLGIARALILQPQLIICDEPVSALDISIQAQILNLLMDLQDQMNLSYIFISHDLSVVRHISDKVMVMYLGKVVEYGKREDIFGFPRHPYTQILLKSSPTIFKKKKEGETYIKGEIPSPFNPPAGCAFHTRCPFVLDICRKETPHLRKTEDRNLACHL